MSKRAIFLDRDGTLIEEIGYLRRAKDIAIYPCALEAVARINQSGALAVVITNQSAVARGFLSEAELQSLHRIIAERFAGKGASLDAFYYCPHHPEAGEGSYTRRCHCRKPEPGLLRQAARDLHIDLRGSYMLGDRLDDVDTGHRAGCRSVLLKTGYGVQELALLNRRQAGDQAPLPRPDHVAEDVLAGVEWILEQGC